MIERPLDGGAYLTSKKGTGSAVFPAQARDMLDRGDNATAWATGTAPRGPMSFVPMASAGQVDSAFAKPANLAPAASPQPLTVPPPPPIMAPPSAPVRHTNNFNAVPTSGRSMKDPSRIIETLARRDRRNTGTQLAAAGFFQGRLDAGSQAEAANARARRDAYEFDTTQQGIESRHLDTLTAQQNREAVDNNFKMSEEARRQADFAQSMEAPKFVPVPESGGGLVMQGKKLASGWVPTPHAPNPRLVPLEGTSLALPYDGSQRIPGLPGFQQTAPSIPPFNVGNMPMPGAPPQFKPIATEDVKPPHTKNFGDKENPNWREFNPATKKWVPVQFEDKNHNGVPDPLEEGGGATSGTSAASNWLNRVLTKKP